MKTLLNARVSEEVKECLEQQANEEGITVSLCTENILKDHFGIYDYEENIPRNTVTIDISIPFRETPDYTLLITWLFTSYMYTNQGVSKPFITRIKSMLENAMADQSFSNELRFEFLKVLNDINRYLLGPDDDSQKFNFCYSGNLFSFNYALFVDEIWKQSH